VTFIRQGTKTDIDVDVRGQQAQACSLFARLFNTPKLEEEEEEESAMI